MKYNEWRKYFNAEMNDLIGKVFSKIEVQENGEELKMTCDDGVFTFYHEQDCCEDVSIESIVGDLSDLIGSPILKAEEVVSQDGQAWQDSSEYEESFTWTFYKLATIKGYVDIRWFGSSNGYYSEGVDLKFEPHSAPKEATC